VFILLDPLQCDEDRKNGRSKCCPVTSKPIKGFSLNKMVLYINSKDYTWGVVFALPLSSMLGFCFWVLNHGYLASTSKPPPKFKPGCASAWGPLGSSGNLGEDMKSRAPFCVENFNNCIFGVHTLILSHNANDRVSSSHSCCMVFDCLDHRAVVTCLKAAIPLLD